MAVRRPATAGLRRGPRSWTLRTRLLLVVTALLTLTSLVVAGASLLALDRFLQERLDDQLTAAVERSQRASRPQPPGPSADADGGRGGRRGRGSGPGFLDAPGQAQGTLGAMVEDGRVLWAGVLDRRGVQQQLDAAAQQQLADVTPDGSPRTVDLGTGLGEYRLVASPPSNGSVLVTGLPLAEVRETVLQLAAVATAVAVAGLLVAAGVGAVVLRTTLRPLQRVAATAAGVTRLRLDRGDVALAVRVPASDTDPRTEVGRVGAALNLMLDHVCAALAARQASEDRVRRFVADASHELRTPLASIRGYAELTRRRPGGLPDDVAHALGRVEGEAVRMTGLVEDLLLLARLDAGRPVERVPVDLSRTLVDGVSDAHVAGPGHRWDLDLPEEPVTVVGDPARLHQVVANLLANARTHTPPGTAVTVTLRSPEPASAGAGAGPRRAVLEVVDDGPGIPPELLSSVFERFARGDASRSRAAGSTGLGLAIVSAVVAAHGGTVSVDSRPGRTAFTVALPVDPPDVGHGASTDLAAATSM